MKKLKIGDTEGQKEILLESGVIKNRGRRMKRKELACVLETIVELLVLGITFMIFLPFAIFFWIYDFVRDLK